MSLSGPHPESRSATTADTTSTGPGSGNTVVTNAAIYTVNPDQPWADAFAFDADGVIIAVGSAKEAMAAAGDNPLVIDAEGGMVLPGFQDPHVHVPEAGINSGLCFMSGRDLDSLEAAGIDPDDPDPQGGVLHRARFSDDSDMLRFDTAKVYIDGIIDLGTASLLEPYDVPLDPLYPSGFNYFPA